MFKTPKVKTRTINYTGNFFFRKQIVVDFVIY